MPAASQSIYASTPFKFIVDSNPYYIHTKLVSRHSPPLDRMINCQMAGAQNGFAVLEEVKEGALERFIEWGLQASHSAKRSAKRQTTSSRSRNLLWNNQQVAVRETFQSGKKSKKGKSRQELKADFIHREHTVRREIPSTRANRGANKDYTEVFLSHARLYVFADKYDIQPLKTLALEELHDTLATYILYRGRTGDILALLRYVYANTGQSARGGEGLRMLLRDYLGYEMSDLMKDGQFKVLMLERGTTVLHSFTA
ncbi:MAG: hypothetical protein Q9215_004723 [Flavoplaca cf. flavocitrina]